MPSKDDELSWIYTIWLDLKFFSQPTKKLDICGQGGGKMQREGRSAGFDMGVKKGPTDRQWSTAKLNEEP